MLNDIATRVHPPGAETTIPNPEQRVLATFTIGLRQLQTYFSLWFAGWPLLSSFISGFFIHPNGAP
jgi:hypothetical protein